MSSMELTLQALVDTEDVDGVLALVSVGDIAAAWCDYYEGFSRHLLAGLPPGDFDGPGWWAVSLLLTREIFRRSDLYDQILLGLVEHAPNDDVLSGIGAGPMENVNWDHEESMSWLEGTVVTHPRLRKCVAVMHAAGEVRPATLERLDAIASEPLPRPQR